MPHAEAAPVQEIASALARRFGPAPKVGLVLGSGLGRVTASIEAAERAAYEAVGLPTSKVAGHDGEIVVGRIGATRVAALSGRVHLYECGDPALVVRGVRALQAWGIEALILTNSSGGIREGLDTGSLVLVTDHLNFQGTSPLVGPAYATRFPDLTEGYDPVWRARLKRAAAAEGITLEEGVYAAMLGPAYETPAEIRMLAVVGADVVGMSTVPEVLAAAELGLPAAAVSVVSNRAAGLSPGKLHHGDVTAAAKEPGDRLAKILVRALSALD